MYRILHEAQIPPIQPRPTKPRGQPTMPVLVATGPNQVWSWDITRVLGPKKWTYFYLYVILDIFSRYVVGWMVANRENSALGNRLIQQSCLKYGVQPEVLTLHSDRGAPMTSQCTAQLLADLGVTRSLSRPQVSDDNPFSESQFKTVKYHPGFPGRFISHPEPREIIVVGAVVWAAGGEAPRQPADVGVRPSDGRPGRGPVRPVTWKGPLTNSRST